MTVQCKQIFKSMFMFVSLWIGTMPLFSEAVFANVFYVDGSHPSANDTNPGTEALPWKTIQKAANVLVAGQKVFVRAGTYKEIHYIEPDTGYGGVKPQNSGTDNAPIVYEAYPGEKVIIDQNFEAAGFFLTNRHNIVIRGFEIRRVIKGGIFLLYGDCRNIVVEENLIHDVRDIAGNNVGGVRLNGAINPIVRNNKIHNIYTTAKKEAGVHSYDMTNALIENNEIYDVDFGVFHKRSSGAKGAIIRRNLIHDSRIGIHYNISADGNEPHIDQEVYENIIYNVEEGIEAVPFGTRVINNGLSIYNNTIVASHNALVVSWWRGVIVHSNFFKSTSEEIVERTYNDCSKIVEFGEVNFNLYAGSGTFRLNHYCNLGGVILNPNKSEQFLNGLTSWRSATGLDANSIASSSEHFVDREALNFRIKPNSSGKTLGKNGNEVGAFGLGATTIGPDIGDDETPPSAPTGLKALP